LVPRTSPASSAARAAPPVARALASSHLGSVSPVILAELTRDATLLRVAAGSAIHRDGDTAAHLEIVVGGLIRVFLSAPDGRTLTVRYCRPGALIGAATLYAEVSRPFAVQALIESRLLRLRPDVVRRAADRDPRVAAALLVETSERVVAFIAELSDYAFTTVRQRVARHLLNLASDQQQGAELVARISQQDLADAVGSVREVIVRVLRELREAGVVETGRHGIVIRDAARLLAGA
jgi:CRP/FNR family transcriptional regulator, cyclic AMP receptor protein